MAAQRRMCVFGNWKSNGGKALVNEIIHFMNSSDLDPRTDVIISPPSLYVDYVRTRLNHPGVSIAIQNKPETNNSYPQPHPQLFCCYTPAMVKDIGCDWAILGPNDVKYDKEGMSKVLQCQEVGLGVVPVIGESLEENDAERTLEVCYEQLQSLAKNVLDWSKVIIAYEPLWAIAGRRLMPDDVQEIVAAIRNWIRLNISPDVAKSIRILYGGSITGENCREYASLEDLDGFLIGKAALNPEFIKIINARYSPKGIITSDNKSNGFLIGKAAHNPEFVKIINAMQVSDKIHIQ